MTFSGSSLLNSRRALFISCVLLYIFVFNYTYISYVVPNYSYIGLTFLSPGFYYLAFSIFICVFPSLWLPLSLVRPSLLLFYFQYFLVFIPSTFILYYSSNPVLQIQDSMLLCTFMFLGISIIQAFYYFPLVRFRYLRVPNLSHVILLITLVTLAYILLTLGHNFRLANLEEIYTVRADMRAAVESSHSRLAIYAQTWLAGFFLPYTFSDGIHRKKKFSIFLSILGYIILFGIGGSKTSLFAVIYLPLVYFWITYSKLYPVISFTGGLSVLLIVPVLLQLISPFVNLWYTAIVHVRMFSIPALLNAQYFDFFHSNPLTYLSHVTGIDLFIEYPYDRSVSFLIGKMYLSENVNSNAGFWASDGLAGFGVFGVVFMSFLCGSLFWYFDSIAYAWKNSFVLVSLTFIATSFTNAPLSTSLLTGGLGLLLLSLHTYPDPALTKELL